MILMMSMFGTAMPTLLSFPEERPVFVREYSTNHYGVLAYFMSRLAMEALITFVQILGKYSFTPLRFTSRISSLTSRPVIMTRN